MLIILGGLPGVGKTAIARGLALALGATHIRIDAIEQGLRRSGRFPADLADAGYVVGYAVAEDALRAGRTVIADSVNPIGLTRQAWRDVATRVGVTAFQVEIVCSDREAHQARIAARTSDMPGHRLPDWGEVETRRYEAWTDADLVVDTAGRTIDDCVVEIMRSARREPLQPS